MKTEHVKTPAATEEVSSDGFEKPVERLNWPQIALLPEKNRGRTGIRTCKSVEQKGNHEKGP
jgi:hypothetical protein